MQGSAHSQAPGELDLFLAILAVAGPGRFLARGTAEGVCGQGSANAKDFSETAQVLPQSSTFPGTKSRGWGLTVVEPIGAK